MNAVDIEQDTSDRPSEVLLRNNIPIDVRATGRLNKPYVDGLCENPAWAKAARQRAQIETMLDPLSPITHRTPT
jgi:hypothetical protein